LAAQQCRLPVAGCGISFPANAPGVDCIAASTQRRRKTRSGIACCCPHPSGWESENSCSFRIGIFPVWLRMTSVLSNDCHSRKDLS
jgi:hypothetical protein